jgi:hypothetical protein
MIGNQRFSVGDYIIVNYIDRPCAKLVAWITGQVGGEYTCLYLSPVAGFDREIKSDLRDATLLKEFGIALHRNRESYWCEQVGNSRATYGDGAPRRWQDIGTPLSLPLRREAQYTEVT